VKKLIAWREQFHQQIEKGAFVVIDKALINLIDDFDRILRIVIK
jgi:hypothetical protein